MIAAGENSVAKPMLPRREKIRFRFAKVGDIRFVGHNDLMVVFERAFRRAKLAVRLTEGFHPKPHLSCPLSLGLGIEGLEEILEIELNEPMSDAEILDRLEPQLETGLSIRQISRHPIQFRTRVALVEYRMPVPAALRAEVESARLAMLAAKTLILERKLPGKPPKRVDLRPFLESIDLESDAVRFRLAVAPEGTARPEEVADYLHLRTTFDDGAVLVRTRVILADELTRADTKPPISKGNPL